MNMMITQKKFILLIGTAALLIIFVALAISIYIKRPLITNLTTQKASTKPTIPQLSGPSIEVTGTIQNHTDQNIILQKQDGHSLTFQIIPSTVFYQCSDLKNSQSCSVKKAKLKKQTTARVYAKGPTALFVVYKL